MFYETSEHPLDKKFRLFVPKRLQEGLERDAEGNLVVWITRGQDGCLFLMSDSTYRRSMENLDLRAFTTREQRIKQRRMFKDTACVALDASGRLLLGERQRRLIELEENAEGKVVVVLVGAGSRVELWPLRRWEKEEALIDAEEVDLVEVDRRGVGEA